MNFSATLRKAFFIIAYYLCCYGKHIKPIPANDEEDELEHMKDYQKQKTKK